MCIGRRKITAEELWSWFKSMNNPNDIFSIYKETQRLSKGEKEKLIKLGVGDSIAMNYITAVEMKKKGTWDAYLEEWEKNKGKTAEERLREYMQERDLSFPGK